MQISSEGCLGQDKKIVFRESLFDTNQHFLVWARQANLRTLLFSVRYRFMCMHQDKSVKD